MKWGALFLFTLTACCPCASSPYDPEPRECRCHRFVNYPTFDDYDEEDFQHRDADRHSLHINEEP